MNFKELRKNAGLTQAQLAEQVGIDQGTVSAYENGTKRPSFDTIPRLALSLGVTTDDIFLAFEIAKRHKEEQINGE